jgi:hypothetical protein
MTLSQVLGHKLAAAEIIHLEIERLLHERDTTIKRLEAYFK